LPALTRPTAALSVDVAEATAEEADEAADERRWVTPATALQGRHQNSMIDHQYISREEYSEIRKDVD
jgi:hypothetical protein